MHISWAWSVQALHSLKQDVTVFKKVQNMLGASVHVSNLSQSAGIERHRKRKCGSALKRFQPALLSRLRPSMPSTNYLNVGEDLAAVTDVRPSLCVSDELFPTVAVCS